MKKDIRDSIVLIAKRAIGNNSYLDREAIMMDCNDIDHAADEIAEAVVQEVDNVKREIFKSLKDKCVFDDVNYAEIIEVFKRFGVEVEE